MAVGHLLTGVGSLSLGEVLNDESHCQSSASTSTKLASKSSSYPWRGNKQTKKQKEAWTSATADQKEDSQENAATGAVAVNEAKSEKIDVALAGDDFISGLGLVLTRWVEATSATTETPPSTKRVTHFHSVRVPSMSIKDYLNRIHKYFFCSDECYVMGLVYIDRIGKIDPSLTVCELTVHRLLVLTVMVAAKFHDDVYYSNAYYAKVAGLSLKEVNALEAKLVKMLDWKVFVDPEEYALYHKLVCQATTAASASKAQRKEPEPEPPARRPASQ